MIHTTSCTLGFNFYILTFVSETNDTSNTSLIVGMNNTMYVSTSVISIMLLLVCVVGVVDQFPILYLFH